MANDALQATKDRRSSLEQVKADSEKLTKRRLEDDGVDFHAEREAEINNQEGVAPSTPVSEVIKADPNQPDEVKSHTVTSKK